jgi:hypothetical protein
VAANEAKIVISADDKASNSLEGITGKAKQLRGAFLAVGAAGAVVTGALGLSMKSFAQAGDEVQKMALRTGLTTEALSELKFALEQSGSNIEGFEKGIRRMASFIQDGRDGLTETTRALDTLGIAVEDFDGLSPEESFDKLSTALAGVEDDLVQSALAQDIFGRSGTALLPLLAQGADGIDKLKQEAHDLGIVFDQDAANAAARLVDAQNTLSKSFQGVQIAIAEGLAPALSGFLEGAAKVVSKISEWAKENPVLTKIIIGFTAALGGLALAIGAIGLALPIVATGLGAVTVGFIGLNVATGGLIIAIGAIGAGLVLLITEFDKVKEVFIKGFNFLIGAAETWVNSWVKGLNIIIDGVNMLGSVFGLEIGNIADVELPRLSQAVSDAADAIEESNESIIESNEEVGKSFDELADDAQEWAEKLVERRDAEIANQMAIINANKDFAAEQIKIRSRVAEENKRLAQEEADAQIIELSRLADAADKFRKEEFDAVRQMGAVLRGQTIGGASLAGISYGGVDPSFFEGFGANLVLNPTMHEHGARQVEWRAAGDFITLPSVVVQGDVYGFDDFADKVEQANSQNRNAGA